VLWGVAILLDYGGPYFFGVEGWRMMPSHFAERFGLIVIIALGESIVAIGVGVANEPISWPIILASILGLTVAGCIWWAYFDVVAIVAERALRRAEGEQRARLARDSYSYLHLPMIAGIILAALGLKKVVEYVGDTSHHQLADALALLPLCAMYCGVALYLLAHAAFRFRTWHHVTWRRVIVAAVLIALIPPAAQLPAIGALGLLTAVLVALIAVEALRFAEFRERVRHEDDSPAEA
jgi:low temperature requirement protein LtrA